MLRRLVVGGVLAGLLASTGMASAAENWSGPLYKVRSDGLSSTPIEGSKAALKRYDDGVRYRVNAIGLKAGHAYTVWLVAWNHPEFCIDPDTERGFSCGTGDFGNAAAFFSVMWGAGGFAEGSTHSFSGERRPLDFSRVIVGPGIGNPTGAEVKMMLRDHGPASSDPAMRRAQTTTVDGGCSDESAAMPATGLHGPHGSYACRDIQATGTV